MSPLGGACLLLPRLSASAAFLISLTSCAVKCSAAVRTEAALRSRFTAGRLRRLSVRTTTLVEVVATEDEEEKDGEERIAELRKEGREAIADGSTSSKSM
jgi:hypothetical protein